MTFNKIFYITIFLTVISLQGFGQFTDKLKISPEKSFDQFCHDNQTVIPAFFNELDLDYPGLEQVKKAVSLHDYKSAARLLKAYFQLKSQKGQPKVAQQKSTSENCITISDNAMKGLFNFQGVDGVVDFKNENAWSYLGPKNDIEWGYFLNRFLYFSSLDQAYRQTHNKKYSSLFNFLVIDWVRRNPAPQVELKTSVWRALETGIRMSEGWVDAFYNFQSSEEFSDTGRLLMLISIFEHAEYLRKFHCVHHNHGVTELTALSGIALAFPEFKFSKDWLTHAFRKMDDEFDYEVLPDGAQIELTSSYHWVVLHTFKAYIETLQAFKVEVPAKFLSKLEQLINYSAYTSRPDGLSPLNNDCDLYENHKNVKECMGSYARTDWEYIVSKGRNGQKPQVNSIMFPWAGQMIMRNGWGEVPEKSQYAFFDVGPWSTSHQHNDKLHLSVYSNGREILCDNGRLYYKYDEKRVYVNLSVGHNVILLDSKGQNEYEQVLTKALELNKDYFISPEADFCMGSYTENFGDRWHAKGIVDTSIPGNHTRAVVYVKNKFWVVFDRIESDEPRAIKPLWHFNPSCNVVSKGQTVETTDKGVGNLLIQPVGKTDWKINLVRGQEKPYIQGWYSIRYNSFEPAYCAEYMANMQDKSEVFAWVMLPYTGDEKPEYSTRLVSVDNNSMVVQVRLKNEKPIEIAVNMNDVKTLKLSDNSNYTGSCIIRGASENDIKIDELNGCNNLNIK